MQPPAAPILKSIEIRQTSRTERKSLSGYARHDTKFSLSRQVFCPLIIKSLRSLVPLSSLIKNVKLRLSHSYTSPYRYKVNVCGEEIHFSTEDLYSLGWFLPRYRRDIHEPKTTALLARLSQIKDDILDIGANLGWFTCVTGAISEATIHSFELDKKNFQRLCTNVSLNGLQNVRTNHTAVANSSGRASYWKEPGSASPMFSLHRDPRDEQKPVEVKSTTLDDYVEENCRSVGVVKIDVEGGEREVLEGGSEVIREFHPHILLEVHPHIESAEGSVREVLALMPESYEMYHIEDFRRDQEGERDLTGKSISPSSIDLHESSMLYAEPPDRPLSDTPPLADQFYEFT